MWDNREYELVKASFPFIICRNNAEIAREYALINKQIDLHGLPKNNGDSRLLSIFLAICDHRVH